MFDVNDVRARLEMLRARDRKLEVFGAGGHRYQLAPLLSEQAARAFETKHGVVLPDDYRAFLCELGNGGAGPFYGICPLGLYGGSGAELEPWTDAVGVLARPFPHRGPWNLPEDRLEPPDEFESDEAEDAWNQRLDAEYHAPALLDGAFHICEHGCALRTVLVVTGPERGNVWYDARTDGGGLRPHLDDDGRHLRFGAWYLRWLDDSLRRR